MPQFEIVYKAEFKIRLYSEPISSGEAGRITGGTGCRKYEHIYSQIDPVNQELSIESEQGSAAAGNQDWQAELKSLRLGFVSGRVVYTEAENLWCDAGLGRLLDVLDQLFGSVQLALSPAEARFPLLDHKLRASRNQLALLPSLPSIAKGFFKFRGCQRVIRRVEDESDVLIVQLPFEAPLALFKARRPRVYHVCADIWAFASRSSRFQGWRRLPALLVGGLIDWLQDRLFRRADVRVVTNGKTLQQHYKAPPGAVVISSTIREQEILSVPRSRLEGEPFRVLYVGYIRHEKGTDLLFEAFERVLREMPDAQLSIVGAKDGGSTAIGASFEKLLNAISHRGNVQFVGHRNFGRELFQCFSDADVLVVPSRTEGTPRVLIEARALGCPVIGTAVGGIPTSIDDGKDGLLVPAEDSKALAEAILRIANDLPLRQRLIEAGVQRARSCTVEVFAHTIAAQALAAVKAH